MRHPKWRGRLAAFVALSRRVPFASGVMDCGVFAQGWAEAVTGVRPLGEIIYSDEEDGMAALRSLGFSDHIAAARSVYPEVPFAELEDGDLAIVETPEGPALGGVGRDHVKIPSRPQGLGAIPLVSVDRGGRVISILKL